MTETNEPTPHYRVTITVEGPDGEVTELVADTVQYPTLTPHYDEPDTDEFSPLRAPRIILAPRLVRLTFSMVPIWDDNGKLYTVKVKEKNANAQRGASPQEGS